MVNKIISKSKKLLTSPQSSVLSAATIIMLMVIASRVLGLVRQRVLAHYFAPADLSLFFAAFRLPDLIFEVLVFGTFSSAFIPVFTKAIKKGNTDAWKIAGAVTNISLLVFGFFAIIAGIFADNLYAVFAPGFGPAERAEIVKIARILFAAQGFFVISYVLTAVLESLRRFLVPALAPLFYNLGIIFGTIFLVSDMKLLSPAIGVLVGAGLHFLIQLPLAIKLGFRFSPSIHLTKDVRKIGKLALPRIVELSFLQISKTVELFLASLISTASYTYFTFGNSLQLLPVGLFGTSIAKAALPTLARQAENMSQFRKTFYNALYQIVFLVLPVATILVVLRIPLVRLVFGSEMFNWEATVQTGIVVSVFAFGVVFQAANSLLSRAFYALHDTKTPVMVAVSGIIIIVLADFIFIKGLGLPVWGLALAYSIGVTYQAILLFSLLSKRIGNVTFINLLSPILKSGVSAIGAGSVMYLVLKIFDRSVWVKRLSFLGKIEASSVIPFEKFVLDTRYTVNLLVLTIAVSLMGAFVYLGIAIVLKQKEVGVFFNLLKRIFIKHKIASIPLKKQEPITPTQTDTTTVQ